MKRFRLMYVKHNTYVQLCIIDDVANKRVNKSFSWLGIDKGYVTPIENWDNKAKQFHPVVNGCTITSAIEDNRRLAQLLEYLNNIIQSYEIKSIEDIAKYYKLMTNVKAEKPITLLEFAKDYRDMWKNGTHPHLRNQKSGNFEIYNKFIHKLEGTHNGIAQDWKDEAQQFANLPIAAITTNDWRNWAKFILKHKLGYRDSVNAFRATVYGYHEKFEDIDFKFGSIKSVNQKGAETVQHRENIGQTFTNKELKLLIDFDVNTILPRCKDKELIKDTCILMLGTLSRPCDILGMRIEDLTYSDEKQCYEWKYAPNKLANEKHTKQSINYKSNAENKICTQIIEKYKGNRTHGFLFPYSFATEDKKEWMDIKYSVNSQTRRITAFLRAFAEAIGSDVIKPTTYIIRKSGITEACKRQDPHIVATVARTSEKEIYNVYMNKEQIALSTTNFLNL